MQKPAQSAKSPASVFSLEGIPPAGQLIPLGLQHVVAILLNLTLLKDQAAKSDS